MKLVLDERKCPAQGKICPAIPACTEGAIHYVADEAAPLGAGSFSITKNVTNAVFASRNAAAQPSNLNDPGKVIMLIHKVIEPQVEVVCGKVKG